MKSLKKLLSVGMLALMGVCGIFSANAQKITSEGNPTQETCREKQASKNSWGPDEDERLKGAVNSYGKNNWQQVSEFVTTRNPRQCRERYLNYLAPDVKNGKWSAEEDALLVNLISQYGTKWLRIRNYFNGRTVSNLYNRYVKLRDGRIEGSKVPWGTEELTYASRFLADHGVTDDITLGILAVDGFIDEYNAGNPAGVKRTSVSLCAQVHIGNIPLKQASN